MENNNQENIKEIKKVKENINEIEKKMKEAFGKIQKVREEISNWNSPRHINWKINKVKEMTPEISEIMKKMEDLGQCLEPILKKIYEERKNK